MVTAETPLLLLAGVLTIVFCGVGGVRLISPVRPWTSEAHFSSKWGSFGVRFLARLSGQTLLDYLVFAVWPWALPQHPPHLSPSCAALNLPPLP